MGASESPACVTVIGIRKELEAASAKRALKIVFDDIGRPFWIEEVLQRTGALGKDEDALPDN